MTRTIRVVIVDDSPFVCRLLSSYLQAAPDVRVVGTALNGPRAVEMIAAVRPDAITLDVEMPGMSGLEVLDQVMRDVPTPVLLVSGVSRNAARTTLEALDRGAVDFVLKYTPGVDTDADQLREEIVAKVRLAARIKVIRSLGLGASTDSRLKISDCRLSRRTLQPAIGNLQSEALPAGVVVIGASTGGPAAVRELLESLPADFPAAVLVVQHLPPTFTRALAEQLERQVALRVKEAEDGDLLRSGWVFVAPGDRHLLVRGNGRVELDSGPRVGGYRPSINLTMQTVAQVFGSRARGVILTGMGDDGTLGLTALRQRGGTTYAQALDTCVVGGMPFEAMVRAGVDHVGSPAEIGRLLCRP
jgi:two-component system chemotaxis response regulator CheB